MTSTRRRLSMSRTSASISGGRGIFWSSSSTTASGLKSPLYSGCWVPFNCCSSVAIFLLSLSLSLSLRVGYSSERKEIATDHTIKDQTQSSSSSTRFLQPGTFETNGNMSVRRAQMNRSGERAKKKKKLNKKNKTKKNFNQLNCIWKWGERKILEGFLTDGIFRHEFIMHERNKHANSERRSRDFQPLHWLFIAVT